MAGKEGKKEKGRVKTGQLWEVLSRVLPEIGMLPGVLPRVLREIGGCSKECSRECSMWGVNRKSTLRSTP